VENDNTTGKAKPKSHKLLMTHSEFIKTAAATSTLNSGLLDVYADRLRYSMPAQAPLVGPLNPLDFTTIIYGGAHAIGTQRE